MRLRHRRHLARLAPLAWPLFAAGLALLALGLQAGSPAWPDPRWDWQPTLAWQQPWRWWTAAGAHWSPQHLRMNLVGCGLLAWLGWRAGLGPRATLAWVLAWPLTQLGLLLQPALAHYGGLSGVLHAGIAVLDIWLLQGPTRDKRLGLALAAGLLLKLMSEQAWTGPAHAVAGWDFPLAPLAHVSGAMAGWLCGAALLRRHRRRPPSAV